MRRLLTFGIVAVLFLTACSSTPSSAQGEVFTSALTGLPSNIDPAVNEGNPSRWVGQVRGGTLVEYDPRSLPGAGCSQLASVEDLRPGVAESWTIEADGAVTFALSDAISAYGNEITAEDVKWTYDRLVALEAGFPGFLMRFIADYAEDAVEVIDEKTVRFNVNSSTGVDVVIWTVFALSIIDSTEAKTHATADDPWASEWLAVNSATFGPWHSTAEDFVPGERIRLTRNPNYEGEFGSFDEINLIAVPESSVRAQLLAAGEVDYAVALTLDGYQALADTEGVTVHTCVSADRVPLVLNLADAQFADPQFRQALSRAINREAIVQGPYRGFATPATSGLSSAYDVAVPTVEEYEFDLETAKEMLAELGFDGRRSVDLLVSSTRPGPQAEGIGVLLRDQLSEVGLDVNLTVVAGASEFVSEFYGAEYEMILYAEPPVIADPYYSLSIYHPTGMFQNSHGYSNEDFDRLVGEVKSSPPGDARDVLIGEIEQLIARDHPFIYLVDLRFNYALASDLGGFTHAPHGELDIARLTRAAP